MNQGTIQDRNLNDTQDYKLMSESMDKVGFSSQEKDNIFRIVAAVMHLGNIAFEEELDDKQGTHVKPRKLLQAACALLVPSC